MLTTEPMAPMAAYQRKVLVLGGGIAGMSFALRMRAQGCAVTLLEADPDWRVAGAGITVTGPTYRAFKRLGVIDDIREAGFRIVTGARFCTPDGKVLADQPMSPIEPDLPTSGGIMRPDLHRILSERTRQAGVDVRLGHTLSKWNDDGEAIEAEFDDRSTSRFDLLVAADGAFSRTRAYMFPDAPPPSYTGRAILIGDAAHSTTPHLASGAGIAIEDAIVLGEELAREANVATAFENFTARRWERCRLVVENSVEIGRLQQAHAPPPEIQGLFHRSEMALLAGI